MENNNKLIDSLEDSKLVTDKINGLVNLQYDLVSELYECKNHAEIVCEVLAIRSELLALTEAIQDELQSNSSCAGKVINDYYKKARELAKSNQN